MLKVKVLGSGCPKCKRLEQKLLQLRQEKQLEFEVEKVTDINDILAYGIMMTPGLVINEKVVCVGKVPSDTELLNYLEEFES